MSTESQRAATEAAKKPPVISDKATPEQILNRIREWIINEPVTAESKFGDGYRQGLRDVRSLIATHVHSDRFEPESTGDSRLTVQQDDALWDAAIPAGGTRPTNVEIHKRVCAVVADMLDEVRAAASGSAEEVEICELPHETIAEEDECESRREELTELRDAVSRMFQLADHWATSDDNATREAARLILHNLPAVQPVGPPLSQRQLTEQMLTEQYAEDIESVIGLNMPMICSQTDALKVRDAVLSVRDRWLEKLRQRLALADMFRDDNNKEVEDLKSQVFNLSTELARATQFRARVGEYLIESVIGDDF